MIDNSLKPSWAELEKVFNEQIATGFGGEIQNNSISFNQDNWDKPQEIRIRYDSYEDLPPDSLQLDFENTSTSEELKNITVSDQPGMGGDYPVQLNTHNYNVDVETVLSISKVKLL